MMGMSLAEWRQFIGPRVVRYFLAAVFFGLFLFAVESSFVIVFQSFLSAIGLLPQEQLLFSRWVPKSLQGAMLALVVFGIFRALAYMGKAYLGGVVNQAFIRYQREKILAVGLHQAQEMDSAELLNIYSERVPQVAGVINLLAQMLLTLSAATLFTILGAKLAFRELCLSLFLLAVILFPLRLLNRRIQALGDGITKNSETMTSILAVGLRNYFFLRVYGLISREINRGLESISAFEAGYRRFYLLYAARNAVPLMGGIIVVALVSYLGVSHWHTEPVRLVAFLYILLRLGQAASESSALFAELRLQFASVARLRDWHIRMAPEMISAMAMQIKQPQQKISQAAAQDSIRLETKALGFRYSGAAAILQNINLSVGRGELLLIMGPSGAGKSTLLALLLGLREPSSGQVLCNGQALAGEKEWLADRVGYVGPEPFLVKGSVRQNLLYGNEHLGAFSDTAIWQALSEARLEADIQALPGQLGAELLEHTQLSTGQKQRLAIARALLRRPKLLILDEATANLDAATEQMILQVLESMRAQMAMIVVSHKDSFANIATQKLYLGA